MSRKVMHLQIKSTGEHKYYGSLVALCDDNEAVIPTSFYHTLKRFNFDTPYENEAVIIRKGFVLTPSEVKAAKNNA